MLPALHRQAQILLPPEFRNYQAKARRRTLKSKPQKSCGTKCTKGSLMLPSRPCAPWLIFRFPGVWHPLPEQATMAFQIPRISESSSCGSCPSLPAFGWCVQHFWACSTFGRVQHFVGVFNIWACSAFCPPPPPSRTHLPQLLQDPQTPSSPDRGCSTRSVFFEGWDPQMCTFGVLGLSCEAPKFWAPHPIGKRLSMGRNKKWVLEDNLSEAVWRTIIRGPVHHRSHCNVGRGKAPQPPQRGGSGGNKQSSSPPPVPLSVSLPVSLRLSHRLSPSFCLFLFLFLKGWGPEGVPKISRFLWFHTTQISG